MMACTRGVSLVTHCTHFPESLTRKLYRKKIPEFALDLSKCPESAKGSPPTRNQPRRRTQEQKEGKSDDDNH